VNQGTEHFARCTVNSAFNNSLMSRLYFFALSFVSILNNILPPIWHLRSNFHISSLLLFMINPCLAQRLLKYNTNLDVLDSTYFVFTAWKLFTYLSELVVGKNLTSPSYLFKMIVISIRFQKSNIRTRTFGSWFFGAKVSSGRPRVRRAIYPLSSYLPLGVVLDSTSRREAKRGQSTNQKGEMSRATYSLISKK